MSTIEDIQNFILEYIRDNCENSPADLGADTNYVERRLLDSFAILNLIMTLESEYEIKFNPQELASPDLRIVSRLAQTVHNKRSYKAPMP